MDLTMMRQRLGGFGKEELLKIFLDTVNLLSKEQYQELEKIIEEYMAKNLSPEKIQAAVKMTEEFVAEQMEAIKGWMAQIDEGELCLETEEYEDYSSGYWDSDWIVEYYDNQGIGDKLMSMIRFAKNCVDDRRYQEADFIYEWLWDMAVSTSNEYDSEPVSLETLAENGIVTVDMEQLALTTLYAVYQGSEADERADNIYLYFSYYPFREMHIEDMFRMGRENLTGTERFWKDWIALLREKSGDTEGRLLQEAILCTAGVEGLVKMADESCKVHPSLYLTAMKEYEKSHDYEQIERVGEKALEKIDECLVIRSEAALKAAYASSCLMHTEKVMRFCWECFRSDTDSRNFLRLFGTGEMAEKYGMRGKEALAGRTKGNSDYYGRNRELRENTVGDMEYRILGFYMGNFQEARLASKNPEGSLGWSGRFIRYGVRLFLLYLYVKPLPSKAAAYVAAEVGFRDDAVYRNTENYENSTDLNNTTESGALTGLDGLLDFESEIAKESRKNNTSIFWNYFQRWKQYFPMGEEEKKKYLTWARKTVCSRADAIVGGQFRGHYGEVAALLSMVSEIKEDMGTPGAKQDMFAEYKRKYPRHSSFQAEMRKYFGKI